MHTIYLNYFFIHYIFLFATDESSESYSQDTDSEPPNSSFPDNEPSISHTGVPPSTSTVHETLTQESIKSKT